ncbi:MAG: four helix bundle protein [Cyanobacteria bacterium P01_C01_bin.147]
MAIREEELEVYQLAFEMAMQIFQLTKRFPVEERYSFTNQRRRLSRSVWANLAAAWRKRRYRAAFMAKLSTSEAEAAATQTWINFAVRCDYLKSEQGQDRSQNYDRLLGKLVKIMHNPSPWLI